MFKKRIALLGVVALVACAILFPPVRGAAESVLSVFRVGDAKTITITVNDIQELMSAAKPEDPAAGADIRTEIADTLSNIMDRFETQTKTLTDVRDFTAFPFSLPESLKAEAPTLHAVNPQSETMTVDTDKINTALAKLGAAVTVDSSYNGSGITVNTPPAIVAEYANVALIATQNVYIDAPDAVINNLWSAFLSIPAIPEDLRAQLAAIDPKTRDIYLPVIEGLGRETALGSTTGYIYTASDLAQVLGSVPGLSDGTLTSELQNENASVLIWTKDGVLYCLVGEKSDSELSQIARSIR